MILVTNINNPDILTCDEIWAIVRSLKTPQYGAKQVSELSPSKDLYHWFLSEKNSFRWTQKAFDEVYTPRFIKEFGREAMVKIEELERLDKEGKNIALVCFCPDEERCHRKIVAGILQGRGIAKVQTDKGRDFSVYNDMLKGENKMKGLMEMVNQIDTTKISKALIRKIRKVGRDREE